ncbi:MAG: ABC transporter ATP-binding protein [Clostridiales bacterium]|nr:ABC transporter ATP-binding protein [Clostridiales bacterium]
MTNLVKEEYSIEVNNVCKDFKVYFDKGYTLKERLLFWKRNRHEVRHVLKNVSFTVKKGEAIGLIGQNGAGKSTTLKLLSKIIYPNSGNIVMRGRVSCLIELGAGFHPDMSGRENIYTNAAIFGLKKEEIDKRLNDIIAFSELEEFIDNPVRTYSSGMYMRLAFSVAINVDADILLIDEILAVGDAAFQAKCFNKLLEIKQKGTTIVIVSHSMDQIKQICDRAIWFHNNEMEQIGTTDFVCERYMRYMFEKEHQVEDKNTEIITEKQCQVDVISTSWNATDKNSCIGFDVLENDGEKSFRWLSKDMGTVFIKNKINYRDITALKITYFNALPLERMKELLFVDVTLNGYKVGRMYCSSGENTVVYDISEFVKHINKNILEVCFKVNYLWKPFDYIKESNDIRTLGIALLNVELLILK